MSPFARRNPAPTDFQLADTVDLEDSMLNEVERARDVVEMAKQFCAWVDVREEQEPHPGPNEQPSSIALSELRPWIYRLKNALRTVEIDG